MSSAFRNGTAECQVRVCFGERLKDEQAGGWLLIVSGQAQLSPAAMLSLPSSDKLIDFLSCSSTAHFICKRCRLESLESFTV